MAIRYEITAGVLPITVYLMQGLTEIDNNVHIIYEEGEFVDVPAGDYYLRFVDSLPCESEYNLNLFTTTTTTTTVESTTTTTTTVEPALRLLFNDIANADTMIGGDSSDVADWNTYFNLPTNGTPFSTCEVDGNEVKLRGGVNIKTKESLFDEDYVGAIIIHIIDEIGCITNIYTHPYFCYGQSLLTEVSLPSISRTGTESFEYCSSLTTFDATITSAGNGSFNGCSSLNGDFSAMTSIPSTCFQECVLLTSDFPIATSIGVSAFQGCVGLINPDFSSVLTIGN